MEIKKTRDYYRSLIIDDLCQCDYCKNYRKEIKKAYPMVSEYLQSIGVDIEKPFETGPLEVDEYGNISYIFAQYDVFGSQEDFIDKNISGVHIYITESHPEHLSEELEKACIVIEISPIVLKWTK